jgi:hypothetical protein
MSAVATAVGVGEGDGEAVGVAGLDGDEPSEAPRPGVALALGLEAVGVATAIGGWLGPLPLVKASARQPMPKPATIAPIRTAIRTNRLFRAESGLEDPGAVVGMRQS